jgi:hypothetical protein
MERCESDRIVAGVLAMPAPAAHRRFKGGEMHEFLLSAEVKGGRVLGIGPRPAPKTEPTNIPR